MKTQTKPPLRAVAYVRRSRERAGYGIASQVDAVRAWCEYRHATLVEVAKDDDVSGAVDPQDRPGFARALELLRAGEVDVLVVSKFDRLARSIIGFGDVLRLVRDEGLQLVVLDPDLDLRRADGRAMASMLIAFADLERSMYIERMAAGRRAKIRAGGYGGGRPRFPKYGAQLVGVAGGLTYEPVPAQVAVIERIRAERESGMTLQAICDGLEADGIAPPSGRAWWPATIRNLSLRAA